jgi:hypothetical protein
MYCSSSISYETTVIDQGQILQKEGRAVEPSAAVAKNKEKSWQQQQNFCSEAVGCWWAKKFSLAALFPSLGMDFLKSPLYYYQGLLSNYVGHYGYYYCSIEAAAGSSKACHIQALRDTPPWSFPLYCWWSVKKDLIVMQAE